MSGATVELELQDSGKRPLVDPHVLIEFFSTENSKQFHASVQLDGAKTVKINLTDPGNSLYRVTLIPSNYRIIQFFLRVTEDQKVTREPVRFPVNPERVVGIAAPAFQQLPQPLQSFLGNASLSAFAVAGPGARLQGAALYDAMPPLLKAALLNLHTKSTNTTLGDGNSVFSKLGMMIELDQDRLFAKVGADLLEETMQDTFFHHVDDTLHRNIQPYRVFTSYKTRDAHGNLQLTFSRNGVVGNDYLVDMDIDLAQGIGHIFEVLQNLVTGSLTNPYDVREILIADQNLPPPYEFVFATSASANVVMTAG